VLIWCTYTLSSVSSFVVVADLLVYFDSDCDYRASHSSSIISFRRLFFSGCQIYYIEEHDNNGYNVYVNNVVRLQCVTTTHSNSNIVKVNTCFTGGVLFLQPGDTIFLRDIAGLRYSLFEAEKSFFGLFRFANAQARSPFN
jgi:TNF(Tumour Necrosis Factor) family